MLTQPPRIDVESDGAKPRKFIFVLLPQFTLLCFASALESLRIANRMAGKKLYDWELMAITLITCSAGTPGWTATFRDFAR